MIDGKLNSKSEGGGPHLVCFSVGRSCKRADKSSKILQAGLLRVRATRAEGKEDGKVSKVVGRIYDTVGR